MALNPVVIFAVMHWISIHWRPIPASVQTEHEVQMNGCSEEQNLKDSSIGRIEFFPSSFQQFNLPFSHHVVLNETLLLLPGCIKLLDPTNLTQS